VLPIFYQRTAFSENGSLELDEDTSRHMIQVLRMQPGDRVILTNGLGARAEVVLEKADKKHCRAGVLTVEEVSRRRPHLDMAVCFTRNAGRNEWLLEKITEMGVRGIIPVVAARTERERMRYDRWNNILAAAMIQSQQFYLPELYEALSLPQLLDKFDDTDQKLIAHCMDEPERLPVARALQAGLDTILLIGPEGDFTPGEAALCAGRGYRSISLGTTRLRTETAAMAGCAYFNLVNHEHL